MSRDCLTVGLRVLVGPGAVIVGRRRISIEPGIFSHATHFESSALHGLNGVFER